MILSLKFVSFSSSENFESIFSFKKLPSYLFDGLEHGALETIGWTVPGDVAPYLQVLGVVRHIEYPTIYTNLRYMVSMLWGFFSHQKYTKNLLSFAKRFRKIRIRKWILLYKKLKFCKGQNFLLEKAWNFICFTSI